MPQLGRLEKGAESTFGSANGLGSGGRGGRGVAGIVGWLRGVHGALVRGSWGGGNAPSWDPGCRGQEMAARWSSENVVVEFRDSQVSWQPNGASWACALPGSLPPTMSGPPRGWRETSSWAGQVEKGPRNCQTRAGEGRALTTLGAFGVGADMVRGTGSGICFGTSKRRDCAPVLKERLPNSGGERGGVRSPRPEVVLSDFGQVAELL